MSRYLVTGGSGSLGSALCKELIKRGHYVRSMDINECALAQQNYSKKYFTKIYGDISDEKRIMKAMRDIDVVIHTAALKNLEITEYNVSDCIRININGTQLISDAAIERKVRHCIFVSSDKAIQPRNAYGASKLMGEEIWRAAGRIQDTTKFTIVRSGNFFQSNGNVWEIWAKQFEEGKPLTITSPEMMRYFIEIEDLIGIIIDADVRNYTIIPKMTEYNMLEALLLKYGESQDYIVIGKRQGEKLREQLKYDDEKIVEINNFYEVVE